MLTLQKMSNALRTLARRHTISWIRMSFASLLDLSTTPINSISSSSSSSSSLQNDNILWLEALKSNACLQDLIIRIYSTGSPAALSGYQETVTPQST